MASFNKADPPELGDDGEVVRHATIDVAVTVHLLYLSSLAHVGVHAAGTVPVKGYSPDAGVIADQLLSLVVKSALHVLHHKLLHQWIRQRCNS